MINSVISKILKQSRRKPFLNTREEAVGVFKCGLDIIGVKEGSDYIAQKITRDWVNEDYTPSKDEMIKCHVDIVVSSIQSLGKLGLNTKNILEALDGNEQI